MEKAQVLIWIIDGYIECYISPNNLLIYYTHNFLHYFSGNGELKYIENGESVVSLLESKSVLRVEIQRVIFAKRKELRYVKSGELR